MYYLPGLVAFHNVPVLLILQLVKAQQGSVSRRSMGTMSPNMDALLGTLLFPRGFSTVFDVIGDVANAYIMQDFLACLVKFYANLHIYTCDASWYFIYALIYLCVCVFVSVSACVRSSVPHCQLKNHLNQFG